MNSLIDKEVFKSPLPDSTYIKSRKMSTQELPLSEDWDKDNLKLSYLFQNLINLRKEFNLLNLRPVDFESNFSDECLSDFKDEMFMSDSDDGEEEIMKELESVEETSEEE